MKVLIFYATYGGGHLSAANAIKEAILNNYPNVELEMVDCMEYVNKAVNKLTVKAYTGMAKKMPKTWGKVYKHSNRGPISGFTKMSNKMFSIKLRTLIKQINPNIIISTHPFSTQMCASLKKHKKIDVKIANILTDFQPHEQWLVKHEYIDYFFLSNEEMKQKLINKGISEQKLYITGIPISEKFAKKYNKEKIKDELNIKQNLKTILFFAGGKYGLAQNNVYEYIENFACNFNNIQVIAISGKNEKIFNKFNEIVETNNAKEKIKIIEFSDKVPELMSISDIVITKPGGITVSESMAIGTPIIAINPIPGQEEENAEFLERNNLAVWIKKNENINERLKEIIYNEEKINQLKENIKKYAKPNSAKNICKIIFEK